MSVIKDKCLNQLKNCLGVLFPSLLQDVSLTAKKDDVPVRSSKSKYQRVNNKNDEEEDDGENDFDEEKSTVMLRHDDSSQSTTGEEPAQFFNEFSSWRTNQQQQQTSQNPQNKATELVDIKSKAPQKKNLLALSENEIEKQKNQIADDDDLFKSFQPNVQERQQKHQEKQQNQLNSFFSNLANTTKDQQQQPNFPVEGGLQLHDEEEESDKKDVLEEKGWDDEINIDIQ